MVGSGVVIRGWIVLVDRRGRLAKMAGGDIGGRPNLPQMSRASQHDLLRRYEVRAEASLAIGRGLPGSLWSVR